MPKIEEHSQMAELRTQGTNVFAFDGTDITQLVCVTGIDLGSDSTSKIETTCLEETKSKSYMPGLSDPGDGSLSIRLDPENDSHLKLIQWAENRTELEFYIGASDSVAPPTVATNAVALPTGRSFWSFKGALTPAVPTFEADSIVGYQFTMQRSTGVTLTPATV
jgi:hypothetical protein